MNEFRVVKCKKCTAPLVELPNETLTFCVQCGYKFSNFSQLQKATYASTTTANSPSNSSSNSPRQGFLEKLQELSAATTTQQSSKTTKQEPSLPNKKSTPIWVTVLKWYVILSVFTGIIMGLFK